MDTLPVCPAPAELRLDRLILSPDAITVVAVARQPRVACPACGTPSSRVHARYRRTLADLPWHGVRVQLHVYVRKFRCEVPTCRRRIFCERLPATTVPYGRRTHRAAAALTAIGLALGGRPGARLAAQLALALSATTLLRHLRATPLAAPPTPRVLGVDDWAWRRGQRYGTILIDLERHTVVDLLPDRTADTFAAWLRAHPGIEIISRDRGGSYAEGARHGAPDAIQVADRFHLLRNLLDAVEQACRRHQPTLRAAAATGVPPPMPASVVRQRRYSGLPRNREGPTAAEQCRTARRARRVARYEQVIALRATGQPMHTIAQTVGLDRRTVARWLAVGHFPERAPRARCGHLVDRFADYLTARYDAGVENGALLAREVHAQGYRGSAASVRRFVIELRRTRPRPSVPTPSTTAPATTAALLPSPRSTAWLFRHIDDPTRVATLSAEERTYVETVCSHCPALAQVRTLATAFRRLLTERDVNAFAPWLVAAATSELRSFAAGIRRDYDAVLAAIVFPWSNGQTEGQVQRLKLLKRTMYGRAGFALLRRRVLHAA